MTASHHSVNGAVIGSLDLGKSNVGTLPAYAINTNGLIMNGTIRASDIAAGSIGCDRMWTETHLKNIIEDEIQSLRDTQKAPDVTDDEFEDGYQTGYNEGMIDGLQQILTRLKKQR